MGIGDIFRDPPSRLLKVTNYYEDGIRDAGKEDFKHINIVGNCTISNWDINSKENPCQQGYKKVYANEKGIRVENNREIMRRDVDYDPDGKNQINFKQAKFSVFTALARMDGNPEDLTINDLKNAKRNLSAFNAKCDNRVKSVTFSEKTGVAVIKIKGDNGDEAFTIDYETELERKAKSKAIALQKQIYGPSLNKNTVAILESIDKEEMAFVVNQFYRPKNNNSLAKDIKREWGLDLDSCKQYICKKLYEQARALNITDITDSGKDGYKDIDNLKELEEWIDKTSQKIIKNM